MNRIPKLNVWKQIAADLSKRPHATTPPPVPSSTNTRWERERAWSATVKWMSENDCMDVISTLKDEDFYSEETFRQSGVSQEDFAGEIGRILKSILEEETWTKRKRQLVTELKQCLEGRGYLEIKGHGVRYVVSHVGGSFIYRVPVTQQGHLRPFRGKTVRVVCTGSGSRSYRTYMVGIVP